VRAIAVLIVLIPLVSARTPSERLKDDRLEAVHSQIVAWKKTRASFPMEGIYQDYRAVFLPEPAPPQAVVQAANNAGVRVVFGASLMNSRNGVLFLHTPGPDFSGIDVIGPPQEEDAARMAAKFKDRPDEALGSDTHAFPDLLPAHRVFFARTHLPPGKATPKPSEDQTDAYAAAFRHATTHILATDLTPDAIAASLDAGRAYVARDWLCDPTGLSFIAQSYFGVFEMGDTVAHNPLTGSVTINARLPVPAAIRLLRDNAVVAEARDWKLDYIVRDQGDYRLEALLPIDGEERPWIYTNAIHVGPPATVNLPAGPASPSVEVEHGITYTEGAPADAEKHKLDLYLPHDKTRFPVLFFVHGGSWRAGDRSLYGSVGDRFAREGIAVAVPSYRLMPQNAHPAQIEDLAAAFNWVYRNIAQRGGDPARIYLVGHSAGAHLAALLALDGKYLNKFTLPRSSIRGVVAISGIFDVSKLETFVTAPDAADASARRDASPIAHAHSGAPHFTVTYCQWDSFGFPKQARDFTLTLKKNFVPARLLYVPGENHISEVLSLVQDHSLLADTVLNVVRGENQ